jgi:hypothetical protein
MATSRFKRWLEMVAVSHGRSLQEERDAIVVSGDVEKREKCRWFEGNLL